MSAIGKKLSLIPVPGDKIPSRARRKAIRPASISIPANEIAATLEIVPIDDALTEAAETVTLTLASSSTFIAVAPPAATVTITDDD